jgi:chromosome segregation ATPase
MQSEKSALSRAIQQNKELKDQLNVLEDAYIKLTNTNADLLNQVQAEKHMNKQLNTAISLKDNEINLLKSSDNNNKVENAIQLIENTKIDDNLEQDWEEIEDVNEVKKEESSSNSEEERNREVERISNSYNELINTLNDKDLLINQLNNQLNELKDKVNSINFDKETLKALVTKN